MSEAQTYLFTPSFNRAIKIRQGDSRLTSHAGAIILREADHRLGLVESLVERMCDPRHPDKIRYTLSELLRERIFALSLGESAQDDVDRLAHDPALRMATWDRSGEQVLDERLASQPTQSRLLGVLAGRAEHREVLRDALADWTERHLNLLPRHFFIVTSWTAEEKDAETVLEHYRRRGTFEDRIGEFNATVHPRLSSPRFEENEALLLLSLLSFNLSSMLRNELEASIGGCWDLGRFQQTVLRAAGRVVRGGRRLWLDLEAAFTPLWDKVLACLQRWRLPTRWKTPHGPSRRAWVPPPAHANLHLTLRL